MKLTFLGAAQQVTGSMYLLELESGYKMLVDCGTSMERTEKDPSRFLPFHHFEPKEINVVLLTHAHIDHSGNLPNLYAYGYEGQVVCTAPTSQLTRLLLRDSALLNEKRKKWIDELRKKMPAKAVGLSTSGLYNVKMAEEASDNFFTLPFHQKFTLSDHVHVTFLPTGHLLGAANVLLSITEKGKEINILFSGDIGRKNYPLLPGPVGLPQVDYLICETTYANRPHVETKTPEDILRAVIQRTCMDKPGRLIIPAFSVGRTQTVLYLLNKLYQEGHIPALKVFVDSPLAIESTKTYEKYPKLLNKEAKDFLEDNDELFDFDNLIYVKDAKESRQIDNYGEPCIIVSAAGMMEGGRIQHHIRQNISNTYCTLFIIGYNAEGTLGRQLMDKQQIVTIKGKEYEVGCEIEVTDAFSGHASHTELLEFISQQSPTSLKSLFLVHGEFQNMQAFKKELEKLGYTGIETPALGQSYELF
jgi:metallo-beta-lactamase family protein